MRIGYHKSILVRQWILGTAYALIGLTSLLWSEGRFLTFFLPFGLSYIGMAFWQKRYKMLEFTPNSVRTIAWFPKREFKYTELTDVGVFAGDYKFKSGTKEIVVSKDSIAAEDLERFLSKFSELQQQVQANAEV